MVIVQPDQSLAFGDDYAIDNIHYNTRPASGATLCSVLGDDRKPLLLDQDSFRFDGARVSRPGTVLTLLPSQSGGT